MKDPTPYRKVLPTRLYDARSRSLSSNGKHVDAYLHIGPQTNRIGLYPFSLGKAMEDTGLSRRALVEALEELHQAKGHQFDPEHQLLLVADHWRHEAPESGNQIVGYAKELAVVACASPVLDAFLDRLEDIPNPPLREFFRALAAVARTGLVPTDDDIRHLATQCGVGITSNRKGSSNPLARGLANQKQKQQQEHEQEHPHGEDSGVGLAVPTPAKKAKAPIFKGSRFVVFPWQADELAAMLGPHAAEFDLHEWFFRASELAAREVAVIAEWWPWLKAKTLAEAARRGLPIASSEAGAPSKQTQRLATAMNEFRGRLHVAGEK